MNKIIFYTILLFVSTSAYCQMNWDDGYVIDINNTRVDGKIMSSTPAMYSVRITFKSNETGQVGYYRPTDLKTWHITKGDLVYESKNYFINSNKGFAVFMRRLCDGKGKVKLYEYWNTDDEMGYTQTFLERDGEMTEVQYGRFRKFMADYFSDCEELKEKIEKKQYKKNDILDIIAEYNEWREFQWH